MRLVLTSLQQTLKTTGSADGTAVAGSITYSSGPMGISLGYHHGEREGGAAKAGQAEADVFHLSAKYCSVRV